MKKTVDIGVQVRKAQVGKPDIATRTVPITWTTGAEVGRVDFWTGVPWTEELSTDPAHVRMGRLQSGAPLLDSHASYRLSGVIGVVENACLADGKGTATVRFSKRADVEPVFQDVQDGIIRNVSVGYRVHKYEDVSTKEDLAAKVRRMRAVDWEPMEVSLVPVGADAGAGVGRDMPATHPCEIEFTERSASTPEPDAEAALTGPPTDNLTATRVRSGFVHKYLG